MNSSQSDTTCDACGNSVLNNVTILCDECRMQLCPKCWSGHGCEHRTATQRHLWEEKHPYRCEQPSDSFYEYESWEDFYRVWGESDEDLNLLFRWDWSIEDARGNPMAPSSDKFEKDGVLRLFWVMQRKGRLSASEVWVCQEDEEEVRQWLHKRWSHMVRLWWPVPPEGAAR